MSRRVGSHARSLNDFVLGQQCDIRIYAQADIPNDVRDAITDQISEVCQGAFRFAHHKSRKEELHCARRNVASADYLIVSMRGPARDGDPDITICGMALVQHTKGVLRSSSLFIDVICSRRDKDGIGPSLWGGIYQLKSALNLTPGVKHIDAITLFDIPTQKSSVRIRDR